MVAVSCRDKIRLSKYRQTVLCFLAPHYMYYNYITFQISIYIFNSINSIMVAEEVRLLKTLVSDLEKELKTKGESLLQFSVGERVTRYSCVLFAVNENSVLEAEVRSLQRKLIKRDGQILKQERELHKLRVRGER